MTRSELIKTAKPILFNTDMVRAILDGRKTVTRRVIKTPKPIPNDAEFIYTAFTPKGRISYRSRSGSEFDEYFVKQPFKCGDILYVRETWCWCPCWDCGLNEPEIGCAEPTARMTFHSQKKEYGCIGYKASFAENEQPPGLETWKPSIHMPKEAARIFLRVTDVRVERLKDISNSSAWGEGVTSWNGFVQLWNSTVKKSDLDRYGWAANPWVWVIEFEKLEVQE